MTIRSGLVRLDEGHRKTGFEGCPDEHVLAYHLKRSPERTYTRACPQHWDRLKDRKRTKAWAGSCAQHAFSTPDGEQSSPRRDGKARLKKLREDHSWQRQPNRLSLACRQMTRARMNTTSIFRRLLVMPAISRPVSPQRCLTLPPCGMILLD